MGWKTGVADHDDSRPVDLRQRGCGWRRRYGQRIIRGLAFGRHLFQLPRVGGKWSIPSEHRWQFRQVSPVDCLSMRMQCNFRGQSFFSIEGSSDVIVAEACSTQLKITSWFTLSVRVLMKTFTDLYNRFPPSCALLPSSGLRLPLLRLPRPIGSYQSSYESNRCRRRGGKCYGSDVGTVDGTVKESMPTK